MGNILISDATLRDGNHAVKHEITADKIAIYCKVADAAKIPIVEVGHGNGIGASSLQVGVSACTDKEALSVARENLINAKLSVHAIPGFATIKKDIIPALDLGVDIVRVASHCTEADLTQRHIEFVRQRGKTVYGVLMMSHMVSSNILLEQAKKMEAYGAEGIIFMDSAGHYLPENVTERVKTLINGLSIHVGFHAHNNLGMAIANSVAAANAGATMLDGCARGFGAGAGNAQLEVLVAVLQRLGYETNIDLYELFNASDIAELELIELVPYIKSISIVSGLAGVFSGFSKHVERIAKEFHLDARDIFFELGQRKVIAGQEDYILEVASNLAKKKELNESES